MGRHKKMGRKKTITARQYKLNQRENAKNYRAKYVKVLSINFHIEKDADILEWLDMQESKQKSIKQVLRQHIDKGNS